MHPAEGRFNSRKILAKGARELVRPPDAVRFVTGSHRTPSGSASICASPGFIQTMRSRP